VAARTIKRVVFADIPPGHWSKDPAELLATAGLLSGYADGSFRYFAPLTRYQFSLMLLAAKNRKSANPPKEVGGEAWAKDPNKEVSRAEAVKLLGISQRPSRPNDPITRGEFAVFLSRTPAGKAAIKRLPPLEEK
jgi:hypothetical protein